MQSDSLNFAQLRSEVGQTVPDTNEAQASFGNELLPEVNTTVPGMATTQIDPRKTMRYYCLPITFRAYI